MAQSFGQMLRDARVSHGLNIDTISRATVIRGYVLQAIEDEDFSVIPPATYGREAVHTYADFLGLDARKVLQLYSEAASEYELRNSGRRRVQGSNSRKNNERAPREGRDRYADSRSPRQRQARSSNTGSTKRDSQRREQRQNRRVEESKRNVRNPQRTQSNRHSDSALSVAGNVLGGAASAVVSAVGGAVSSHKKVDYNHSIYADRKQGGFPGSRSSKRIPNGYSRNIMSTRGFNDRGNGSGRNILPFFIAVVLILGVLVVAAHFLFSKPDSVTASSSNTAASTSSSTGVVISGLNDPGASGTVEQELKVVPIAPTAAVFTYVIDDGEDCYLEIYLDGGSSPSVAGVYTGPKKQTFDVTGTLSFVTSRPGVVTLKLDGQSVELTDDNGDGIYVYDVDFNDILAEWKEKNGQ